MKLIYFLTFFFLLSCASTPKGSTKIVYSDIVEFLKIGISTESDVSGKLGVPFSRIEKNDYYTYNYNGPSGFQRASLNFDKKTQKLTGYLWIPTESDKEASLAQAKSYFQGAQFIESADHKDIHAKSVVLLVDKNQGITIRFDQNRNIVEAIAEYNGLSRSPATSNKKISNNE